MYTLQIFSKVFYDRHRIFAVFAGIVEKNMKNLKKTLDKQKKIYYTIRATEA